MLDTKRIPQHIAIIPDGNRRWAKSHEATTCDGHHKGADTLIEIVKTAANLTVKTITFYTFSTENWARSQDEIDALMDLLKEFLIEQRQSMLDNGIRFNTIGDLTPFSQDILYTIEETKKATAHCDAVNLVLALNYGGRDEIRRAIHNIVDDYGKQTIKKEDITEQKIAQYLDTANWPDPDLIIRTSGEQRLSNFLLWQSSYTEFYIATVYWPDFTPEHLHKAILDFQTRERRLGGA